MGCWAQDNAHALMEGPGVPEKSEEEGTTMTDPREETRLAALLEVWDEIQMIGASASSGAAGADAVSQEPTKASRSLAALNDDTAMKFTRLTSSASASTQAPASASPPSTPRTGLLEDGN